jgi:hypothetical protein
MKNFSHESKSKYTSSGRWLCPILMRRFLMDQSTTLKLGIKGNPNFGLVRTLMVGKNNDPLI